MHVDALSAIYSNASNNRYLQKETAGLFHKIPVLGKFHGDITRLSIHPFSNSDNSASALHTTSEIRMTHYRYHVTPVLYRKMKLVLFIRLSRHNGKGEYTSLMGEMGQHSYVFAQEMKCTG